MRQVIKLAGALWTVFATADAQTAGDPKLTVRVYDYAGVSNVTLLKAESAAQRIFRKAGIDSKWIGCPKDAGERPRYPACSGPGRAEDVILKLVPNAVEGFGVRLEALGLAISTSDGRPANHAFVFFLRVKEAARQHGKIPLYTFLGHVMVHEIAHVLLGPDMHHLAGILKPRWQPADLREMGIGRLVFSSKQVYALRAKARERELSAMSPARSNPIFELVTVTDLSGATEQLQSPVVLHELLLARIGLGMSLVPSSVADLQEAKVLNAQAAVYSERGLYNEAEPLYRQALSIEEECLGPERLEVARTLSALAEVLFQLERYRDAEPLCRRALGIREKALGGEHLDVAFSLNNLAEILRATSRYVAADPLYRRSLRIMAERLGPNHSSIAVVLNNLGTLHASTGDVAKAQSCFRRAIEIMDKSGGGGGRQSAVILSNLAVIYLDLGKHREAESAVVRSLEFEQNAANLSVYAEVLRRTRRLADAARIDARIQDLRAQDE